MNVRENVIYFIKKNIFIVLVLIELCPLLALSYAKFNINSECYNDDSMLGSNLSDSAKDYGNDKCKNSDWLLPQTN